MKDDVISMPEQRHAGPNLLLLTILYAGLMFAGGSRLSAAFGIPHDSPEKAVAYVAQHGWSIQLGSFSNCSPQFRWAFSLQPPSAACGFSVSALQESPSRFLAASVRR